MIYRLVLIKIILFYSVLSAMEGSDEQKYFEILFETDLLINALEHFSLKGSNDILDQNSKDFGGKYEHISNMLYKSRYGFSDEQLIDEKTWKIDVTAEIENIVDYELKGFLWAYLIKHGLTKQMNGKHNLLFYAVDKGKLQALNVILDYYTYNKELINVRDSTGKTVLHYAVLRALKKTAVEEKELKVELDMIQALCSHKHIDLYAIDSDERTIFDYCKENTQNGPLESLFKKEKHSWDCYIL